MDFEREGKKNIFGYEFEIYVANKRKLKAFCEKEKKIAASEILEFIELVMMEVTKSEMKIILVIMEKRVRLSLVGSFCSQKISIGLGMRNL